jgi:16S rRNA (guanine966-N2)-methyltransferase
LLRASQVLVAHSDARKWLESQPPGTFDIIFADPPFQEQLHEAVLEIIGQSGTLKARGFVYLESSATRAGAITPTGWSCWREKVMGDVRMQVFRSEQ